MLGIILAAGIGSRLRPMTNKKPKCLVKSAGKPIIQYQIDAYRKAGINEIIIIIGYEGKAIKDYFKHTKDIKITFIENKYYEHTNNMFSLYLANKIVKGKKFILNNADLCIDNTIIKTLIDHPSHDAIAIDTSVYNDESMKVSISNEGIINDISKSIGRDSSHGCSIDFYKFSEEAGRIFFEEITKIIENNSNLTDWTEVALQSLFKEGKLNFHPVNIAGRKWVEVDNYDDLALSDRIFSGFDEAISKIKNVYFDLDGTIYIGSSPIPGAKETICKLKDQGKNIYYLSNNSSKNKLDYIKLLDSMGITATSDNIILSTDSVVDFLKKNNVKKIHVLGTKALSGILYENGFDINTLQPEYVVIGYDTELTYNKLKEACKYINSGVDYIATHCDMFCPSEYGPIPDIGSIVEMLKATTQRNPSAVFGKPFPGMIKECNPEESLIIGDRLHTDILMAKKIGCLGLLVLTGETTRDILDTSTVQPDFTLKSVADI